MSSEVDILKSIKDTPDWERFNEVFNVYPTMGSDDCGYRYDPINNVIYRERVNRGARYTYIAKADGLDIYKVGRTNNLQIRIKRLHHEYPYSTLGLEPIAYCLGDIERDIKMWSSCDSRELPEPFKKTCELLFFNEEDINRVIRECGFIRIHGELPGNLNVTERTIYNPENGQFIKRQYLAE